ncbi:MAG: hypothetical protein HYZ79_07515 [Candidatus Melainabacteria bacterium]|nr:hypothetical protein [Candidatus Melainabacteria bacterium]
MSDKEIIDDIFPDLEPKLFHSCSKPDIVEIEGKEIKINKNPDLKQESLDPLSKVSGFMRQAEEKILSFIKKSKN